MPRGFGGRGGFGGPPLMRPGGGARIGCFGGLLRPLIAGIIGFLLGRNVSNGAARREADPREDELRRREDDVRRREEAVREAEREREQGR